MLQWILDFKRHRRRYRRLQLLHKTVQGMFANEPVALITHVM
jgi:hypothetical protein